MSHASPNKRKAMMCSSTTTIEPKEDEMSVPLVVSGVSNLRVSKAPLAIKKHRPFDDDASASDPQECEHSTFEPKHHYVKDETDCFRQGVVEVPALMELLQLVGACPICKRKIDCPKVERNDETGVVALTMRCGNRGCGFMTNWCSSPSSFSGRPGNQQN